MTDTVEGVVLKNYVGPRIVGRRIAEIHQHSRYPHPASEYRVGEVGRYDPLVFRFDDGTWTLLQANNDGARNELSVWAPPPSYLADFHADWLVGIGVADGDDLKAIRDKEDAVTRAERLRSDRERYEELRARFEGNDDGLPTSDEVTKGAQAP